MLAQQLADGRAISGSATTVRRLPRGAEDCVTPRGFTRGTATAVADA